MITEATSISTSYRMNGWMMPINQEAKRIVGELAGIRRLAEHLLSMLTFLRTVVGWYHSRSSP